MWTDHTEYEEYQKLQLSMVVRYQHNTLGKISSILLSKISQKISRYHFFFSISHTPRPLLTWDLGKQGPENNKKNGLGNFSSGCPAKTSLNWSENQFREGYASFYL